MKRLILVHVIVLIFTTPICAQYYFVTAKNGLIVRDNPYIEAQKIGKLPYNTKVLVTKIAPLSFVIEDGDKTVKGQWFKVSAAFEEYIINGYVFSGYLSQSKDEKIKSEKEQQSKPSFKSKEEPMGLYKGNAYLMDGDTVIVAKKTLKDLISIDRITKEVFDSKNNIYDSFMEGAEHTIQKDSSLVVLCQNNSEIEFVNKYGQDEWDEVNYLSVGTYDGLDLSLIYAAGYEWGKYLLVNRKICDVTHNNLHGIPSFSEDNKTAISVSLEDSRGMVIFVYTYSDSRLHLKMRLDMEAFYVVGVTSFISERSVYFNSTKTSREKNDTANKEEQEYFKITFKDGSF